MSALMNTQKHGVDHVKYCFLLQRPFAYLLFMIHRISPDCCLLRCDRCRCICCNRRIQTVIILITGGLNAISGQHGIIHPQPATGTVFNNQIRVTCPYPFQPFQIGTFMLQHSLSHALSVNLCTDTRFNIIIHLYISYAILFYNTVYYRICIFPYLRIAIIQLVSASIINPFSMTHKEVLIRELFRQITVDSHDFHLQPYPRNHSLASDIIRHLPDTVWKTLFTFLPFPHAVPPVPVGIPSGIYTKILTSCLCCRINQRVFLFFCRMPPQAVHIVIKNYRKFLIVFIFPADSAAVSRQCIHGLIQPVMFAFRRSCHAYSYRHRRKRFSRCQMLKPMGINLIRSADCKIQMSILIPNLPVPGTVMLNLPEESRSHTGILQICHWQVFLSRPVSCIGNPNHTR